MKIVDNKGFLHGKLAELERLELGRFFFGDKGRKVPGGELFLPWPRYNFLLSGGKRLCLPLAGEPTWLDARTGDVQVSGRGTWELHTWDSSHELICIVPRDDYLRVSYYIVRPDESGGMIKENIAYHTPQNYSEALRHCADALSACATHPEAAPPLAKALIRLAMTECAAAPAAEQGKAANLRRRMSRWLENHFYEKIGRDDAASVFGVTPGYVSRLFKEGSGGSFAGRLTELRIEFAKTLLAESDLTVCQVAEQCGFDDHVYFTRRFREMCGVPPGKYRAGIMTP